MCWILDPSMMCACAQELGQDRIYHKLCFRIFHNWLLIIRQIVYRFSVFWFISYKAQDKLGKKYFFGKIVLEMKRWIIKLKRMNNVRRWGFFIKLTVLSQNEAYKNFAFKLVLPNWVPIFKNCFMQPKRIWTAPSPPCKWFLIEYGEMI